MIKAKSMSPSSLLDIPEDVFYETLFSHLQINELLRLRRVCQWTKVLSEDYLQSHPRSKGKVTVSIHHSAEGDDSLESFVQKDSTSSIKLPTTRFKLDFRTTQVFRHPCIARFLEQYGNQIEHLAVSRLSIPMQEDELSFYESLPNLRTLKVIDSTELCGRSQKEIILPRTFRTLKSLKIPNFNRCMPRQTNVHWKLVEFCTGLEVFGNTMLVSQHKDHFKEMCQILEQNDHRHFQHYDMNAHNCSIWRNNALPGLFEMMIGHNVKLINVTADILGGLGRIHLEKIASLILSIKDLQMPRDFNFHKGVLLPNVNKIECLSVIGEDLCPASERQRRGWSGVLPGVTKLEVTIPKDVGDPENLSALWESFPNLVELEVTNDEGLTNVAFMSEPFLRLRKLRKLSLKFLPSRTGLTDVVFREVFRKMRLREFHLHSDSPLASITSAGIRSLLTGPFRQTIENFPFRGWSLATMSKEKFLRLSKEFPGNQGL